MRLTPLKPCRSLPPLAAATSHESRTPAHEKHLRGRTCVRYFEARAGSIFIQSFCFVGRWILHNDDSQMRREVAQTASSEQLTGRGMVRKCQS